MWDLNPPSFYYPPPLRVLGIYAPGHFLIFSPHPGPHLSHLVPKCQPSAPPSEQVGLAESGLSGSCPSLAFPGA